MARLPGGDRIKVKAAGGVADLAALAGSRSFGSNCVSLVSVSSIFSDPLFGPPLPSNGCP
jgi:hypothetical protein